MIRIKRNLKFLVKASRDPIITKNTSMNQNERNSSFPYDVRLSRNGKIAERDLVVE